MDSEVFRWERFLAFGDMDPAGILYYPRFLHYCHQAFEAFMAEVAGMSYAQFLSVEKLGFPAVHVEADYRRPFPYGETMEIAIRVEEVGDRSLRLRYIAGLVGDDRVCAEAVVTTALVDMDEFRSREISEPLRRSLLRFSRSS
jgi:4-hydroxybenzoyl-CoA thioesterase